MITALFHLIVGLTIGYFTTPHKHVPAAMSVAPNFSGTSWNEQTPYRAPWTPPGFVFGLVWSILYIFIGLVEDRPSMKRWSGIFTIHALLLHLWPIVFFGYRLYGVSIIVMALLVIVVVFISTLIPRKDIWAQLMWSLYLLWLIYAFSLNMYASSAAFTHQCHLTDQVCDVWAWKIKELHESCNMIVCPNASRLERFVQSVAGIAHPMIR